MERRRCVREDEVWSVGERRRVLFVGSFILSGRRCFFLGFGIFRWKCFLKKVFMVGVVGGCWV